MVETNTREHFLNKDISVKFIAINDLIQKYFFDAINRDNNKPVNSMQNNAFVEEYFSKEEILKIENFKAYKRQIEWIAGRYAIKTILQKKLDNKDIKGIKIHSKSLGSPYLFEYPDWHISITHSRSYAAGAVSFNKNTRIGIDLEKICEKKSVEFMRLVFTDREIEYLKDMDAVALYKSWCIKEAYLKYVEKGFSMSMKKTEYIDNNIYVCNVKQHNLLSHIEIMNDDYIFAMVYDK